MTSTPMEQKIIKDALNTDIFFQSLLQIGDSDDSDNEEDCLMNNFLQSSTPSFCYADVGKSRQWLKNLLLEESSESDDDDDESEIDPALEIHQMMLRYRDQYHANPMLAKYMYYSSDLLSGKNKWPAHRQSVKKKLLKKKPLNQTLKQEKNKRGSAGSVLQQEMLLHANQLSLGTFKSGLHYKGNANAFNEKINQGNIAKKRALSLSRKRSISIAALRRQIWKNISKKEIPKAYRQHTQNQASKLALLKKASKEASKKIRAKAHDSRLRAKKEIVITRARRMTREAQLFWKKYVRVEKSQRKHAEKQALAQLKIDEAMKEVQKQQQKLKFLITQTELYANFVSGKLTHTSSEEANPAVSDTSHEEATVKVDVENVSDEYPENDYSKERAFSNANAAFLRHQSKMIMFSNTERLLKDKVTDLNESRPQPKLLRGQLTGYQLVGVNWIFNLYAHGLNGILADDMGLGKTVQTIAFFADLAERFDVWGPFLVIAPASTLNNWHQEFARFLPDFKVLPYWGTTSERKVLRLFWNQKSEATSQTSAPFHVLITSYQLAISDVRYFQRIQWHYIVFDEAQALKSSSSIRWRTLLEFNCRNRLLLTGTPIQNTMAELWALLHFIMPTLFDNHAEFNEWFSKNIENHIDNKSNIDQIDRILTELELLRATVSTLTKEVSPENVIAFDFQGDLSRLHMILKPFILRRLKCDVEHELTAKVEVRVLCQLSPRQKVLYDALQKNILAKELLRAQSYSGQSTNNIVLMNLVMQFRKVCNHPDIFHSREISSPFFLKLSPYTMPRIVHDFVYSPTSTSRKHLKYFYSDLNIHAPGNIRRSLNEEARGLSAFSFLPLINMSIDEYWSVFSKDIQKRLLQIDAEVAIRKKLIHYQLFGNLHPGHLHQRTWRTFRKIHFDKHITSPFNNKPLILMTDFRDFHSYSSSDESLFSDLLFVAPATSTMGHSSYTLTCVSEAKNTITCNPKSPVEVAHTEQSLDDVTDKSVQQSITSSRHRIVSSIRTNQIAEIPRHFNSLYTPKVYCVDRDVYCNDNSALHRFKLVKDQLKAMARKSTVRMSVPVRVPVRERLISDSGKLQALDMLLSRLKDGGHRVLIYSQMTKMIDILEEYMMMRRHLYVRLDGSCRISSRRDTVAGFQSSDNIFAFLLSTRAGGLGINLTAADTVIFYDSDWNPTVDQQAMDRAHRLGQTKQVTVYRLVCKGTVDERMLARAEAKSAIQRMVIQDGYFKTDSLNQKEMVSLLLDDDQIAKAAQKDDLLKKTFEKVKSTGKRKYRKSGIKEGKKKKTADSNSSSSSGAKDASSSQLFSGVDNLKQTPQIINISSKTSSSDESYLKCATQSGQSNEDQLIVVDESFDSLELQEPSQVIRGKRKRGRPRIRPIIAPKKPRLTTRPAMQRRWQGTTRRGRGSRGGRRGRGISGRAAAMAGARAGAMAASVATFDPQMSYFSSTSTGS